MFHHLRGTLVQTLPARLVVDVGGVGYDLLVPVSVARRAPPVGREVTVLTHLVVREDEWLLVGFWDAHERELFRRLIALSGVGVAMALQILGAATPDEFALAIERQDVAFLKRIKGVGEKTAKLIILKLKGAKMVLPEEEGALPPGPAADAALALETMGVPRRDAAERVARALKENPDAALEDLIKASLRP